MGSLARALVAVLLRGPSAARSNDPATRPASGERCDLSAYLPLIRIPG